MSDIVEKWGRPVAERGFAQIPNYLLLLNLFLDEDRKLSPLELLILLQLVGTWWKKSDKPFPSMRTLATRCGVSERQIQRSINNLVKIGLIVREKRKSKGLISSNAYNLEPLVVVLEEVARSYPNEFPRRVHRDVAERINAKMLSLSSGKAWARVWDGELSVLSEIHGDMLVVRKGGQRIEVPAAYWNSLPLAQD